MKIAGYFINENTFTEYCYEFNQNKTIKNKNRKITYCILCISKLLLYFKLIRSCFNIHWNLYYIV